MNANATDELLTVPEAASRLRLHRVSVYRLVRTGQLEALRIGDAGPLRIPAEAVEALLRPARNEARHVTIVVGGDTSNRGDRPGAVATSCDACGTLSGSQARTSGSWTSRTPASSASPVRAPASRPRPSRRAWC